MTGRARVKVLVSGRVQGVGFRAAARTAGQRLGLAGWVENLADGRVEAEAEGPRVALDAFVRYVSKGPPPARVDGVLATWAEYRGDLEPF